MIVWIYGGTLKMVLEANANDDITIELIVTAKKQLKLILFFLYRNSKLCSNGKIMDQAIKAYIY